MLPATDLLVVIPAHDEEALVSRALRALRASSGHLRRTRPGVRVHVAVGAHRCTDRTAEIAASGLSGFTTATVIRDFTSTTVGGVRARLVRALLPWIPDRNPQTVWVFSTDADSEVPVSWLSDTLDRAEHDAAHAVIGMTDLIDWNASPAARAEYDEIIAAGLTEDGHRHVYAANLAVRLDAYLDAGGFPSVASGEDHALVAALRAHGATIATPTQPRVRTSGRMPGRAAHGLGSLLTGIAGAARTAEHGVPA